MGDIGAVLIINGIKKNELLIIVILAIIMIFINKNVLKNVKLKLKYFIFMKIHFMKSILLKK